jgi:ribonuclease Z
MKNAKMNQQFRLTFLIVLSLVFEPGYAQIKVTLLGTGVPQPTMERFGPGTLIEVDGQFFLFDCGRGVSQRLWQQKIQLGKVNKVFLTHLHSDHTVGLPDLWLTGWLPANFGRRSRPLEVWGPAGTIQLMNGLQAAYRWDIETRIKEKNKIDSAISVKSHEIKEGIVYNDGKTKITCFLVDHADFIDSAYGFRLDYEGHSIVISGDTRYSTNLIKYATGADVLIHEVAVARPELIEKSATARQILSFHTSPEDAGKVFRSHLKNT